MNAKDENLVDSWISRRKGRLPRKTDTTKTPHAVVQPKPQQPLQPGLRSAAKPEHNGTRPLPQPNQAPRQPQAEVVAVASPEEQPARVRRPEEHAAQPQAPVAPETPDTSVAAVFQPIAGADRNWIWFLVFPMAFAICFSAWFWFATPQHNFTAVHIRSDNAITSLEAGSDIAVKQCCPIPRDEIAIARTHLHDATVLCSDAKTAANTAVDTLGSIVTRLVARRLTRIGTQESLSCSQAAALATSLARAAHRSQAVVALHAHALNQTNHAVDHLDQAAKGVKQARSALYADRKTKHTNALGQIKEIAGFSTDSSTDHVMGTYSDQKTTLAIISEVREHVVSASSFTEAERALWHRVSEDLSELGRSLNQTVIANKPRATICIDSEAYRALAEAVDVVVEKVAVRS